MTSTAIKSEPKVSLIRVDREDINPARVKSLQEAIADFTAHAKDRDTSFVGTWAWVGNILSGVTASEMWWALKGDRVVSYFINTPQQLVNGAWTLFINQGWGARDMTRKQKQEFLKTVAADAKSKGYSVVQFITTRRSDLMADFAGSEWEDGGTLFEMRFER